MKRYLALFLASILAFSSASNIIAYDESEDTDEFTYEEDYDFDQWYTQYIKEERIARGLDPDNINIRVNGKVLNLTLKPFYQSGNSLVPVRQVLEAMGAEVTYNKLTKIITAKANDITVKVTVDKDIISVTKDGVETTDVMGVSVINKGGSTYLPIRHIANALGFDVHWIDDYELIEIINKTEIIKQIDSNTEILNEYLDDVRYDFSQNISSKAKYNVTGTFYGDETNNDISAIIDTDVLLSNEAVNLSTNVTTDFKFLADLIRNYSEDFANSLENNNKFTFDTILNLKDGIQYVKSSNQADTYGKDYADKWLETESSYSMDEQYSILLNDYTFGSLIYDVVMIYSQYNWYIEDYYKPINQAKTAVIQLLGDSNFTKTATGYSLSLSEASIIKLIQDNKDLFEEFIPYNKSISDLIKYKLNFDLNLNYNNNKLVATNAKLFVNTGAPITFEFQNNSKNQFESEMTLTARGSIIGKVFVTGKSTSTYTTMQPKLKPDGQTFTFFDYFNDMYDDCDE